MRYMPHPLRLLWRRYQPEPIEFCAGFGLVLLGLTALLTDDVTFTGWAWALITAAAAVGLTTMWATLRGWSAHRRGDLAGACCVLWCLLLSVASWDWGWNTREAAPAALALGSLLAWVKDWDEP